MKTSEKKKWHHKKRIAKQEKAVRLSKGEESVREKCCPRVKILNFNWKDILCRSDIVSGLILLIFPKTSLVRYDEDITSVGKSQPM